MTSAGTPSAPSPTAAGPAPSGRPGPLRFGVVGSGWRAEFYLRMAQLMPERFEVTAVVSRTPERGAEVTAQWGVPTVRTVHQLVTGDRPDLVVVSVPWAVTPVVTQELVGADVPVLAETPPAPDVEGLRALWSEVGASDLVQVAEHSPFMPEHVARSQLVRDGVLGEVSQVQVSSTHMYHAMAVVRLMLDAGHGPATVTARRFTGPLLDPMTRHGWTGATRPQDAGTTLALLDLGGGRSAVYDFTDNQWHNPLRTDRLVVRGSHGEIVDDRVTRWVDPSTVVAAPVERRQTGVGQELSGFDLEHLSYEGRVVYRNPFVGARLSDDDIAVATLLDRCGAWLRGEGAPPYPLAEASQDHLLALAVEDAVRTGDSVTTATEAWGR